MLGSVVSQPGTVASGGKSADASVTSGAAANDSNAHATSAASASAATPYPPPPYDASGATWHPGKVPTSLKSGNAAAKAGMTSPEKRVGNAKATIASQLRKK